ncbi:hypothetical protein SAMN06269250_3272 [Spirosoma fluviale]|uniref:Uncharacterized protein n=1 Tax=Spirosoma fluviale TaxID=1597977 RepID=A0A286G396_9BACT|nr:hypothetical protein SAMN06269250_3272 [Spirosoma fluviale]
MILFFMSLYSIFKQAHTPVDHGYKVSFIYILSDIITQ